MFATETTVLAELKLLGLGPFVLGGRVISLLAHCASKRDDISHCNILLVER